MFFAFTTRDAAERMFFAFVTLDPQGVPGFDSSAIE
jgi:hypothetical protein